VASIEDGFTYILNCPDEFLSTPTTEVGVTESQGASGVAVAVRKEPKAPEFWNETIAASMVEPPSVTVSENDVEPGTYNCGLSCCCMANIASDMATITSPGIGDATTSRGPKGLCISLTSKYWPVPRLFTALTDHCQVPPIDLREKEEELPDTNDAI